MEWLNLFKAALLGIIQGITEWLPVSSTGHMILADQFIRLNVSEEFMEMFEVVVQFGSILAVLLLYFHKLNPISPKKSAAQRRDTWSLWGKVLIACVPAGLIGIPFNDEIDTLFYKPIPIAVALIVYGVLFIALERWNKTRTPRVKSLHDITVQTALIIGAFQMLSLIPGTSRSGSTILGAILIGCARPVAAEFSFFLAIPTMLGASALKLLKFGLPSGAELAVLITGMVVAFIVSVFAIRFLMEYVRKHDFQAFGWYRIVLGVLVLAFFLAPNMH